MDKHNAARRLLGRERLDEERVVIDRPAHAPACGSAWKSDPGGGVIGIEI
jgi:hypothetical protein